MFGGIKKEVKKLFSKLKGGERRSLEPISVFLPKTQNLRSRLIDPRYPREALSMIENAVFTNPILSQVHNLFINLANTGHTVEVKPQNENALDEIKNFARRFDMDSFCNALFSQLSLYGAISCEIVVSEKLDGIEKIVRVHPLYIYFVYDEEKDEFLPYQYIKSELIELNPITYRYIPLLTIDGSPYGIPPMLASLSLIDATNAFTQELQSFANKLGLMGFLDVKFQPLQRSPGETEFEYQERCLKFLEAQGKAITENLSKGVFLHFEGTEVNFKDISASLAGVKEILSTLEKWTIESAKSQPALLGFSEGYTETWATVSLHIFISQLKNYHRIVERFLEYTYRLMLLLKGYQVEDVNVSFNDPPSFNAREEEEIRKIRAETVIALLQAGLISQDEARKLLEEVLL